MYDPIMRVLTLLEILQARDSVTGAELARRLEIDLRTVQRYVVRLKDLGIPVHSTPGVGGAYRLRPGFRMPPLLFTNEETLAVALGLRALRHVGLESFVPATEGALAKLERMLPATLRECIHTVEDVVLMEPSPWMVPASGQTIVAAAAAIRNCQRIRFQYESHAKAVSEREVEPYAVLHSDDRWYLVGFCLARQELRTFRLDRLSGLETSETTFERPESFDARAYFASHMPFVQSLYKIDVWIDMPVEEAKHSFAMWRIVTESDQGGTRLRCTRDTLESFAAMLLSIGKRIVVNHPSELRDVFTQLAAQALQAGAARTENIVTTPTGRLVS
jgi:predicted DNA-binding transcriptional regulator YafY